MISIQLCIYIVFKKYLSSYFRYFNLIMSLSKFLHWLHEKFCSFKVSSSEVSDIESSVYEGLSALLQKGQTLKVDIPFYGIAVPRDKDDEVKPYRDLFCVEKIIPVGSFFEKTKICTPNEFDFDIKLNVGNIDIHQGCRPGRVQVTFESSRQKWLEILGRLFCSMIEAALKAMTSAEKTIRRDSGTLHITSQGISAGTQARLQFKWKGASREFDIHVDVVPSIPCTDIFIAELAKNEHFPSSFHQLVKDQPCYLVPKPCSPNCQKCFHVSFSQAELYLMQSLDDGHRECYRIMKWLLVHHEDILYTYQLKMAVLDHVYNSNCQSKGCIDECVLAMLAFLLENYNELKMPNFFMHDCCSITKDGEGKQCYLDYLVDATGLDMSLLPVLPVDAEAYGYKNYDWLDMFGWFEFQRRCLSLMIDVLRYFSQVGIKLWLSYRHMVMVLAMFFDGLSSNLIPSLCARGRPTMREWRDKVPNFSQRVFIPAFSLILEKIQALLHKIFDVPGVWSTPSIQLCLPCPATGYSQGSVGSAMLRNPRNRDLILRQGAMCYFAQLEGSSWCPVAFGKMSFIEPFDESSNAFFSHFTSLSQGGPRSRLIRGNTQKADLAEEDEIPDFKGPFHFNVRYDGEAFQKNIVSRWHYKRCLIEFLLCRMVAALHLQ